MSRDSHDRESHADARGMISCRIKTSNRDIFGISYDFQWSEYFERTNGVKEGVGENGNHITAGSFIHDETIFIRRQWRNQGESVYFKHNTSARPEKKSPD